MAGDARLIGPRPEDSTLPAAGDPPPASPWLSGERYERKERLGRGAHKEVYLAQDLRLDREVAVSVIGGVPARGVAWERLMREVRITAQLDDHPHIVTVHDVEAAGGTVWIVSQYVRGGSLADVLAREPSGIPLGDAVAIAGQIADALTFAHDHGVVHRDVKPGNILLADRRTALLSDFGVALLADRARLTDTGVPVGTPAYMSPEQARGEPADARSDLYALGATLFELVCGRPPFVGATEAVIAQHLTRPPPDPRTLNAAVPDGLARLIVRLLAKRPDDRPQTAGAVRVALQRVMADTPLDQEADRAEPLPIALAGDAARPFVGRGASLAALRRAWEHATAGRPELTVVSGEAGIGKSALIAAFAREVHADGAIVLHGACDEEPLVSYQPFVEALRHLVAHRPDVVARLDPCWSPELTELARLVPELRDRIPADPGGARAIEGQERYLLFEAVVALLSAGAADRPLLLVLDDLHWADKPTAQLLRHLMRASVSGVLVVLCAARREDRDAPQPLAATLSDLSRQRGGGPERLTRIALAGLDEQETLALVGARQARPVDGAFVRLLHDQTAGNPFFIEETLRGLRDADLDTGESAARALHSLGVPAGAQEVIQRRLAVLGADAVRLLTCAAICGPEFRLDVLGEVLGAGVADLTAPLERALSAGLVVEAEFGHYAFCHALVREALYGGVVSEVGRERLHLAVGEALERLDGDDAHAPQLALHFHAARHVGGADKAVRYALAAAEGAQRTLAYEEAAAFELRAGEALEVLGPEHEAQRADLLHGVGHLRWKAGDRSGAQDAFLLEAELARARGDAQRLARAALGYAGRSYDAEAIDPQLRALLEDALAQLPRDSAALRARVLARLAEALHPIDGSRAIELSREAVAIARRSGDGDALVGALAGHHMALLHIAHLPERLTVGQEWVALADAIGREGVAQALHWRTYDLLELGDVEAARAAHARLAALAIRLRQPLYRHFAASCEVKWLQMDGRFEAAERKAREAYEHGRRAQGGHVRLLYAGQLFGLRRDEGRLREVPAEVAWLIGTDPTLPIWRAGLIVARCEAGDADGARAQLARLTRDDFAAIPRDMFWLGALCLLAEGCVAVGDSAVGERLRRRLEPFVDRNAQVGLATFLGPVRGFVAGLAVLVGDIAGARRHFETALAADTAPAARTIEARTRCAYGELLLAQGEAADAERARGLLESALATAQETGMAGVARRAAAALGDERGA